MRTGFNIGIILKRGRCLGAKESSNIDSEKYYNNVESLIEKCKTGKEPGIQNAIRSYYTSLSNKENASEYFWQPLELIDRMNSINESVSDKLLLDYTNNILPYVEDIPYVIETVERNEYNFTESQRDLLDTSLKELLIADRICNNHNKLSSRFNIESKIPAYKRLGLSYLVDNCANCISTYNIKQYQKFNFVLEEVYYILEKNNLKYDMNELIKLSLDYFLRENQYVSNSDIINLRTVINESPIIEENYNSNPDSKIWYLYEDVEPRSISDIINTFLICNNKSPEYLNKLVVDIYKETTNVDIIYNTNKLIYEIWRYYIIDNENDNSGYLNIINTIYNSIYEKIIEGSDPCSTEDLEILLDKIKETEEYILTISNTDRSYIVLSSKFMDAIDKIVKDIKEDIASILNHQSNLDSIKAANADSKVYTFDNYRLYRLNNVIYNANEFLKLLSSEEAKNRINKDCNFKEVLNKSYTADLSKEFVTSHYPSYIGADNKFDILIKQYFVNSDNQKYVQDFANWVCKIYNDNLQYSNSLLSKSAYFYYIIKENIIEIRLKDSSVIVLTDEEKAECDKYFEESDYTYLDMLDKVLEDTNKVYTNNSIDIDKQIFEFVNCDKFDLEHFKVALETISYLDINKSTVELIGEKFINYIYSKDLITESSSLVDIEKEVSKAIANWKHVNADYDIQLEAYNLFLDNLIDASYNEASMADGWDDDDDDYDEDEEDEEEEKDSKENKKDEKKDKEPEKKEEKKEDKKEESSPKSRSTKINLTNIKLGLKGLATKMKDMNTKQKEFSKRLDYSVTSTVNGMRKALQEERREAIIKNTICPSFSRVIKNAIGLAALGIATGGVTIPIITAMAGFALNKKLMDKERVLILDEIETEIEVIEKEMAIAESNNQLKKYRTLLRYKKELQRTYQRIKYNVKISKNLSINNGTPGSSTED